MWAGEMSSSAARRAGGVWSRSRAWWMGSGLGRELQCTLEVVLGQAAKPVTLGVAGARDPQRAGDQVQVHAQLVEPETVLIKAAPAQLPVVPAQPHAHPPLLYPAIH